jgi:hypothetical protein
MSHDLANTLSEKLTTILETVYYLWRLLYVKKAIEAINPQWLCEIRYLKINFLFLSRLKLQNP